MNRTLVGLIASLVFFTSLLIPFIWNADRQGLGFTGSTALWSGYVLICSAMLLGIFFGSLYRNLSTLEGSINIISEVVKVFKSPGFWRAICVAPLVFMALYATTTGIPGDLPSVLLAFQNGFFWENVLKKAGAAQ